MKKDRDILEQYLYENTLSGELILDLVDEYSLYIYYLQQVYGENFELQLRKPFSSPIRCKDDTPSFSVYESNNSFYDYLWKDSARQMSGAIFKLIKEIKGYRTYDEVYQDINIEFDLGIGSNVKPNQTKIVLKDRPISRGDIRIRIKSKPFSAEGLKFWNQYYVDENLLKWKQVKEVEYVWYSDEQTIPYHCKELTFAYPEYDRETKEWRYQIYSPYADKQYKFRNDLISTQIFGLNHLTYSSDTLIITKSNKDILCLKLFDVESISPKSETTVINQGVITELSKKYSRIITLFDNDEAGILGASKYDLEHVIIPIESGCKDFSDYLKMYGKESSHQLVSKFLAKD